ncbi:MAG: hypothetical protein AB7G75_25360, partial [Candidatus Binatia bacterium]
NLDCLHFIPTAAVDDICSCTFARGWKKITRNKEAQRIGATLIRMWSFGYFSLAILEAGTHDRQRKFQK